MNCTHFKLTSLPNGQGLAPPSLSVCCYLLLAPAMTRNGGTEGGLASNGADADPVRCGSASEEEEETGRHFYVQAPVSREKGGGVGGVMACDLCVCRTVDALWAASS